MSAGWEAILTGTGGQLKKGKSFTKSITQNPVFLKKRQIISHFIPGEKKTTNIQNKNNNKEINRIQKKV